MLELKGSIPALVTPFRDGSVDIEALERLVEWHIAQGSDGLVAVGTTGESPTVSKIEHKDVIKRVVDLVAGQIFLLFQYMHQVFFDPQLAHLFLDLESVGKLLPGQIASLPTEPGEVDVGKPRLQFRFSHPGRWRLIPLR
mgnify:CR=1 FL=1